MCRGVRRWTPLAVICTNKHPCTHFTKMLCIRYYLYMVFRAEYRSTPTRPDQALQAVRSKQRGCVSVQRNSEMLATSHSSVLSPNAACQPYKGPCTLNRTAFAKKAWQPNISTYAAGKEHSQAAPRKPQDKQVKQVCTFWQTFMLTFSGCYLFYSPKPAVLLAQGLHAQHAVISCCML